MLLEYFSDITTCFRNEDGQRLARLLKVDERTHPPGLVAHLHSSNQVHAVCQQRLIDDYADLVYHHLECLKLLSSGSVEEAFEQQKKACECFFEQHKEQGGGWLVPALEAMVVDYRLLAVRADKVLNLGKDKSKVREVKTFLDNCFRYTIMGHAGGASGMSKRQAALFIVNNQFKVYFALGTLQLCRNFIRTVGQRNFPPLDTFPISQVVTYRFYVGRLKVFEDDIAGAHEDLMFAFRNCPVSARKNVRLILEYLVPVKLILGSLPSQALLDKYQLTELASITAAVRKGSVVELSAALQTHQSYFIAKGMYLALNKLKLVTYRNLFHKIFRAQEKLINDEHMEGNVHWLRMKQMVATFKQYGEYDTVLQYLREDPSADPSYVAEMAQGEGDMAFDQMECVLANLIFKGYLKGYIAHEKGIVVLSKKEAFPKLSTVDL